MLYLVIDLEKPMELKIFSRMESKMGFQRENLRVKQLEQMMQLHLVTQMVLMLERCSDQRMVPKMAGG